MVTCRERKPGADAHLPRKLHAARGRVVPVARRSKGVARVQNEWIIGRPCRERRVELHVVGPRRVVVELFHGTRVGDPYRWLENANDPAVKLWVQAQNVRTRAYLDGLTLRKIIDLRLAKLVNP